MIAATAIEKSFQTIPAIAQIDVYVNQGSIFGLLGSNGAGKSTLMRMLAGILQPDKGEVKIDEQIVYENPAIKERCFFISDEQYFYPNSTPNEMKDFYKMLYPRFDEKRYQDLLGAFGLDGSRKIRTFSKGMKKQVSIICSLSVGVDYLFYDETFDGLDPVMRQAVKSFIADDVAERGLTAIIASHNLREMEDICDHIGLLHKGGILLAQSLDEIKVNMFRAQCVFAKPLQEDQLADIRVVKIEQRGSLYTITARGSRQTVETSIKALQPIFFEMLPLSLEEVFIRETEAVGYDVKKILH